MAYPRRLLGPDESIAKEFRPHWNMILGPIVAGSVAVILAVTAMVVEPFPARGWVAIGLPVIAVVLSIRRLANWITTQHVLTNERVIYRAGVLSRRGKEIPLEVINDVSFAQTPFERIVKAGDLLIESAGELGQSRYTDIPRPEEIQGLIYRLREERTLRMRGGSASSVASELESLARLLDQGILTQDEFDRQKRRLLGDG